MDVIVVGAGGFGRELLQYALDARKVDPSLVVKGFLDDDPRSLDGVGQVLGYGILGDTHTYAIQEHDRFVVSLGNPTLRQLLAERLAQRGARFVSIVHPSAWIAPTARVEDGCVVGPFAAVGSFARVEPHVILNLYTAAGHDTRIGACSVLSPYSVVNGGGALGQRVFLGTHATVTPNVRVGDDSKVSAGAVVYREVPSRSLATGNPAKTFPLDEPRAAAPSPER